MVEPALPPVLDEGLAGGELVVGDALVPLLHGDQELPARRGGHRRTGAAPHRTRCGGSIPGRCGPRARLRTPSGRGTPPTTASGPSAPSSWGSPRYSTSCLSLRAGGTNAFTRRSSSMAPGHEARVLDEAATVLGVRREVVEVVTELALGRVEAGEDEHHAHPQQVVLAERLAVDPGRRASTTACRRRLPGVGGGGPPACRRSTPAARPWRVGPALGVLAAEPGEDRGHPPDEQRRVLDGEVDRRQEDRRWGTDRRSLRSDRTGRCR